MDGFDPNAKPRSLQRIYAHYHRVLITLLENLVEDPEVKTIWMGERGHIRMGEGEANTYRKAIYLLDDLNDGYKAWLSELEQVQAEGQGRAGGKRPGLLLPGLKEAVTHARYIYQTPFASQKLSKADVIRKVQQRLETVKANLLEFEHYATRVDPRRERLIAEIALLQRGLTTLAQHNAPRFRYRFQITKHKLRLYMAGANGETSEEVYIRDVGLILTGPKGKHLDIVEADKRKSRSDRVRLTPLLAFARSEIYDEDAWQAAKSR